VQRMQPIDPTYAARGAERRGLLLKQRHDEICRRRPALNRPRSAGPHRQVGIPLLDCGRRPRIHRGFALGSQHRLARETGLPEATVAGPETAPSPFRPARRAASDAALARGEAAMVGHRQVVASGGTR
jgi:hypothetical protein